MSDDTDKKSRPTSNVFTKLPQKVIQEMKEAFTMIDQNRDGLIDISDLKEMYSNLGYSPSDKTLQDMIKEAPAQINFTVFLSLFSEKLSGSVPSDKVLDEMVKEAPGSQLNFTAFLSLFSDKISGTDTEDTLKHAFGMFDPHGTGNIPEEYMKDLLQNMGDNFTADEIRQVWKEAPISAGKVDYNAFVNKIKGKEQEEM